MIFEIPELQKHFDRTVSIVKGCPPDEVPVCALLDAWQWFHRSEGDESPAAKEAIRQLLSPELRPALRSWYHRSRENMNPAAIAFRNHLSELAGESFGT